MATRMVTTVFAVQGEADYKTAVKNINAVLKELDSEMKLSQERFRDNEGSVEALRSKLDILKRIFDENRGKLETLLDAYDTATKNAEKYRVECERLSEEIKENRDRLNEMKAAGESSTDAYRNLAKETVDLEKAFKNNAAHMQTSERNAQGFATQANEARVAMEKLGREIDETSEYFEEASGSADQYAHSMDEVGDAADEMGNKTSSAVDAMAAALTAAGVEQAFDRIRDAMLECSEAFIDFESGFAGVEKTIDATPEQLAELEEGIKRLSTEIPATTTEIEKVAESAGQLGIATDDILNFTEVMIKLGTSTSMVAEEAATSLAQFANITGMDAGDYERLGSVVVDLGNKFATTEQKIIGLGTRLASTGDIVGMSKDEIMAYATALTSVGVEAEAGGTALSKMFKYIELAVASGNAEKYAEISGMLADDFRALWENDPSEALRRFLEGLGKLEDSGGNVLVTLNDMGITEVRLSNAIQVLSGSSKLLTDALDTAKTAWDENTALAVEAGKRYETTESKMKILQNRAELLKIEIGEDFIRTVSPAIEKLGDMTEGLTDLAEESPAVSSAFAGIGGAMAGLTGLTVVAAGIKAVSSALAIFGTTAGPVALTVAAVAGLGAAIANYAANVNAVSDEVERFVEANDALLSAIENSGSTYEDTSAAIDNNRDSVNSLINRVMELTGELEKTPATNMLVQAAVDDLNERLPGLGLTYDEVTGKINMTRDALVRFADEAENTAKLDALSKYMEDLAGQKVELEVRMDLNEREIDAAKQKYEDAIDEFNSFYESLGWAAEFTKYFTPEYSELSDAVWQARDDLKALEEAQGELQTAMNPLNAAIETSRDRYEELSQSIEKTGTTFADAQNEIADVQSNLNDVLAEYVEASKRENEELARDQEERLKSEEDGQKASLKKHQKYLDDLLEAHQKEQKNELKTFQKSLDERYDALDKSLDEELKRKKEAHDDALDLLDEEYKAQLRVYDEEKYDKIKKLEDEIAAIDAKTEAEEEEIEAQERADRLAEAEAKIDASTGNERIKAREEYNKLKEKYDREDLLKERNLEKERLEIQIDEIEAEYKAKEEAFKAETEQRKQQLEEKYAIEEAALKESHENQRAILKEQLDLELEDFREKQSDKTDVYREYLDAQLESFKQNQSATLDAMKASFENEKAELERQQDIRRQEATKSAEDTIKAIEQEVRKVGETSEKVGEDFVAGFAKGIEKSENRVVSAARKVALSADKALRRELQINSPSRKAMQIGNFFGEGLALGLTQSEGEVSAAMKRLAGEFDIDMDVAQEFSRAQSSILKDSVRMPEITQDLSAVYWQGLRNMENTSRSVEDHAMRSGVPIEITVISQLDGKVVSQSVSRTQWVNNQTTLRTNGIKNR